MGRWHHTPPRKRRHHRSTATRAAVCSDFLREDIVNRRSLAFGLVAAALGMTVVSAIGGTQMRAVTGPAGYSIAWGACLGSPGVRCGTLPVLLDWSRPGEQRVSVAVAKGPADDPSR